MNYWDIRTPQPAVKLPWPYIGGTLSSESQTYADTTHAAFITSPRPSIYLAGRFQRREELQGYRDRLICHGFFVTSRWLTIEPLYDNLPLAAKIDIEDIRVCDILVVFLEDVNVEIPHAENTGSRLWEAGIAMGLGKPVYCIGDPDNTHRREVVFTYLPMFNGHIFPTFDDFFTSMAGAA